MLSWWEGLLLGVVQGLSEFLPISSSGHLVLAQGLLGYRSPGVFFEVMVHVGTLASVVIVYRHRLAGLVKGTLTGDRASWRYVLLLGVASVPAAIAGLGFKDFFERQFDSYTVVGVSFLVTALILWSTKWTLTRTDRRSVGFRQAAWMGLAQALAILPGISRSGTTIAAGLWTHTDPKPAAEFSFLMAVVAIAGSGLVVAADLDPAAQMLGPGHLWAFGGALVSGIFAIRFLVWLLHRNRFHHFAPYCAAVGVFTLVWFRVVS